MLIHRLAIVLALAAAYPAGSPAQTFLQMSDPQFGMYTDNRGFEHETANFEFAIATANRLKPAFVIVTGDLVNLAGNAAQVAEYHRIAARLNPAIKLFNVPGNHDLGNQATAESLAAYRKNFGPDYYTFQVAGITGIVLDSGLEKDAQKVPEESARMEAWLKTALETARRQGVLHPIVFQHISFFLETIDEPDQYFNIQLETRRRYLKLFHEYGVQQVFAGHYHRNAEGYDGNLDMVTTGPVGRPSGGARSGFRVVRISGSSVTHQYYDFGDLPDQLTSAAVVR